MEYLYYQKMNVFDYERNVFLNCPFDEQYVPFFQAAVFAVMDSGFNVRCGLEESDASQIRIQKICNQIGDSKFGIHDLSRVQLDEHSRLPRFNMPLEFGIFLGAKFLSVGKQKQKMCLVFDEDPFRYQKYLSDIAGQDISSHHNDPHVLATKIRDWLASVSSERIASGSVVWERYQRFRKELKGLCKSAKQISEELTYIDYIMHVEEFVKVKVDVLTTGLKMRWSDKLEDPSLHQVGEAIKGFKGGSNSFAILAKSGSGRTYMQTIGGASVGYSLEHQEGSIEEHYECIDDLSEEKVIAAFQAYRVGDEGWRTEFHWEKKKFL